MFKKFSLQLFAEGGAAGDGSAQSAAGEAAENGANAPVVDITAEKDNAEQRKSDYAKFKSEYKDLFDGEIKQAIERRFKGQKNLEKTNAELTEKVNGISPLLDLFKQKYGTDDVAELQELIMQDESFFEREAMKEGVSVEQYKEMYKLTQENKRLKAAQEQQEQQAHVAEIYNKWLTQAEETAKLYPNFNLENEIENETFARMLQSGVDVTAAYQATHFDEIVSGTARLVAEEVGAKQVLENKAQHTRPAENGTNRGSGAMFGKDVTKLSKAEREEIDRRVLRGEKVSF